MTKKIFWQLFAKAPKYCLKDKVYKKFKENFQPQFLCWNPHLINILT